MSTAKAINTLTAGGVLSPGCSALLDSFPTRIQRQIIDAFVDAADRRAKFEMPPIDVEILLRTLVEKELNRRMIFGGARSTSFLCSTHSLAYQGRSSKE